MALTGNIVNPMYASERAAVKPHQLVEAVRSGLSIPRTVITNRRDRALAFAGTEAQIIFKTITTWHYDLRETRLVGESELKGFRPVESAPDVFQEYLDGPFDIRATVVGDRVFAARIDFKRGRSPIDGRLDRVPVDAYTLDDGTARSLRKLHARLGLVYGAYDFRMSTSGVPYFLEVNPDGQYLYVEIETGLPISNELARLLVRHSDAAGSRGTVPTIA